MSRKSSWYLITSDEIEQIWNRLQDVGNADPESQYRIDEILQVINNVRDRLA